MSGPNSHRHHCQNCGAALSGPYCPKCGQHDVDYNRSFGHILEDGLEGMLHLDNRFLKTAWYLFTRPGFLTKEFIAGRRTRYTHPLRLYIFASFLFFAAQALVGHKTNPADAVAAKAVADGTAREAQEEADERMSHVEKNPPAEKLSDSPPAPVTNGEGASQGTTKSPWLRSLFRPMSGPQERGALVREMAHLMPTMLFLCMPLLGAVLKLVYFRSGRLYIEHLIFALHVMAFVYLAMLAGILAMALARPIGDGMESFAGFAVFCLATWVVFRSFRTVYDQGRMKTLLKLGLVGCAYGAILIVGICAVVLASAFIVAREA
jgi:hypothetical protein